MIKIPYPIKLNERIKFEAEYINALSNEIDTTSINLLLNKVNFQGSPLSFDIIIKSNFSILIQISKEIEHYFIAKRFNKKKMNNFKALFNYKKNQARIADFFMRQNYFPISTCYYCNIDFINAFKDISDYYDTLDFVNNADKKELMLIKGIGESKADKIINLRSNQKKINNIEELNFSRSITKELKDFKIQNSANHFTLDHVLPQSKYKYLSLSLYNFVPSCYSCNSKFKKAFEVGIIDDLKYISPSSDDFILDDNKILEFKIYYRNQLKNISSESDYKLKELIHSNNSLIIEYLQMFKIRGRYVFHKSKITELIKMKIKYPEVKIQDISRLTKISPNQLKKDIFGKELFEDDSNEPFVKLKKDIAKDLNIIP